MQQWAGKEHDWFCQSWIFNLMCYFKNSGRWGFLAGLIFPLQLIAYSHGTVTRYKSNEDYVYVRGRGRGKYICEECGIRCKKPSMLKKHIRTHTDVRPYHCNYCNFSFKTKGKATLLGMVFPFFLSTWKYYSFLLSVDCSWTKEVLSLWHFII